MQGDDRRISRAQRKRRPDQSDADAEAFKEAVQKMPEAAQLLGVERIHQPDRPGDIRGQLRMGAVHMTAESELAAELRRMIDLQKVEVKKLETELEHSKELSEHRLK